MDDDAELVESGTFRIDRARALEKLKEFQFADPSMYILAFARCAVASGATEIRIENLDDGACKLHFNGIPIPDSRLKDPFEALFTEEGEDTSKAERHLALGLLGALSTQPRSLSVESNHTALIIESIEKFDSKTHKEMYPRTAITIAWEAKLLNNAPSPLPALLAGCAMLPIDLIIDDACIPTLPESEGVPVSAFEEGSVKGFLVAAPVKDGLFSFMSSDYPSRLHLYEKGVQIDIVEHDFPIAVDVHLESTRFATTATHSGVVDNEDYAAAVETARSHCEDLVLKAALEQTERASKDLRGYLTVHGLGSKHMPTWMRLLGGTPVVGKHKKEEIEALGREARVAAWLRFTASTLLDDPERDLTSKARSALWRCPLYVSATGRPISLLQLHHQYKRIGYIPVTDPGSIYPDAWIFRFEPFLHVVWILDKDDPCLKSLFDNSLSEWGAIAAAWDISRLPFRKAFKDKDYYDSAASS